jgi:hypothetical protein
MIVMTTSVMIAEMIGAMTDVAKTTTTATTITAKSCLHRHHLKGTTPMVRSSQLTGDQFHRLRSPNDQKQQIELIKCKGDRTCQHRNPATSALV